MTSTSPSSITEGQGGPTRSSGGGPIAVSTGQYPLDTTNTSMQGSVSHDPTDVRNVRHRANPNGGWFPQPREGDYFVQTIRRLPGASKLPWYFLAPSNNSRTPAVYDGLDRGTIFGPVHDYESTLSSFGFVSILVPPPWSMIPEADKDMIPELVWINVSKNRNRHGHPAGVIWAKRVENEVVESWRREGWFDRRIALPPMEDS
jgi:hypothetical protein